MYADRDYVELASLEDGDEQAGDLRDLIARRKDLEVRMREAAKELRFEEAARLRDEMHRVEARLLKGGQAP